MTDTTAVPGVPIPRRLMVSLALLTASMLLVELIVTRIFSVLFYYHYSFFAVSLVMSGLAFGGLIASRWDLRGATEEDFDARLANLAGISSVALLGAYLVLVLGPPLDPLESPSIWNVALMSVLFVPGLTALGAYLASAFARREAWIGRLYAVDLASAGLACVAAIGLLRWIQGPASLLSASLLSALASWALVPRKGWVRLLTTLSAAISVLGLVLSLTSSGAVFSLPMNEEPLLERWNEHSRVIVAQQRGRFRRLGIVIDRTAVTILPEVTIRLPGAPIPVEPWWGGGDQDIAYRLERRLDRTAVIGVGGGRDVLAALANGAGHVDGYELNGLIVDILRNGFPEWNNMAHWPEVSLIHGEARTRIRHAGRKYDVIQASLIDTWAAMAGGGFVLAENGLYTLEGWTVFLDALTENGVLTMTRFYLPSAPAEAQRLVSLAATSLEAQGIRDPADHIILSVNGMGERLSRLHSTRVTILVSKIPFTETEVARVQAMAKAEGMTLLAAPGLPSTDPTINRLLVPAHRLEAIRESPYDISAPTDLRPFFFLQIRPWHVLTREAGKSGLILEITFKAVRVMLLLGGISLLFSVLVLAFGVLTVPSPTAGREQLRLFRWMGLYFLGIGFGYILVQLGLHQQLILVIGHPTLALSVVLGSMLIGTGIGSWASGRLFPLARMHLAWLAILAALGLLVAGVPYLAELGEISTPLGRALAVGGLTGTVGFVLGFGFPLGVRLVAPTGEWAVQKMWAINGAASIAGSALAAILSLWLGCRGVLGAGLFAYLLVAISGVLATRIHRRQAR